MMEVGKEVELGLNGEGESHKKHYNHFELNSSKMPS